MLLLQREIPELYYNFIPPLRGHSDDGSKASE